MLIALYYVWKKIAPVVVPIFKAIAWIYRLFVPRVTVVGGSDPNAEHIRMQRQLEDDVVYPSMMRENNQW